MLAEGFFVKILIGNCLGNEEGQSPTLPRFSLE